MFTRFIYPLRLREIVSWRVRKLFPNANDQDISLHFNKKVKLDLSNTDVGHQSIIFNGFYELGLTQTLVSLANEGGLFVDVGANYGYYSCLWAGAKQDNSVVAFEASPMNFKAIENNISKNGFTNVITLVSKAIGKEKGVMRFDIHNENNQTGWGGLSLDEHFNSVEVEVDTLDGYAEQNGIDQIKALKIDTEGADTWVLYGAVNLLKNKKIDHIFFEHNEPRMKLLNIEEAEAKDFLIEMGYDVERISPSDFYAYLKGE